MNSIDFIRLFQDLDLVSDVFVLSFFLEVCDCVIDRLENENEKRRMFANDTRISRSDDEEEFSKPSGRAFNYS